MHQQGQKVEHVDADENVKHTINKEYLDTTEQPTWNSYLSSRARSEVVPCCGSPVILVDAA